ncbi:MAG: hypothetical protein ABIQ44_00145, partial [Chloroflexia bacterium]
NWIISVALILLISIAWLVNQSLTKQGIFAFSTTGPAAPWQAQWYLARTEATKMGSAPILAHIYARNADGSDIADPNKALEVDFNFYTPSGSSFTVTIIDINPPVLKSMTRSSSPVLNSEWYKNYERPANAAAYEINLSPRQALQETLADALTRIDAWRLRGDIQLELPYILGNGAGSTPPLQWDVFYDPVHDAKLVDPSSYKGGALFYRLSPSTWKIISTEWLDDLLFPATATPSTTTSP